MTSFKTFILVVGFVLCSLFCISCDEGGKDKITTNEISNITNNNTTEVVSADPEPEYVGTLSALDSDLVVSEVCYNSQVLYVFTKTVTKEVTKEVVKPNTCKCKHGKHHCKPEVSTETVTVTKIKTVSTMYHLDDLGRPMKCN
jgi:hypothetical protein